jgi:hypothetical protein
MRAGTDVKERRRQPIVPTCLVAAILVVACCVIVALVIPTRRVPPPESVVIHAEITQMQMALELCRSEWGDYPPDFTNEDDVRAYLRKVFPQYGPPEGEGDVYAQFVEDLRKNYGLDATRLDPASALVFWLGGLPQTRPERPFEPWIPAGFHDDPTSPFEPGSPRTLPFFAFDSDRMQRCDPSGPTCPLRYYSNSRHLGPFVYFKARYIAELERYEYGVAVTPGDPATKIEPSSCRLAPDNMAVPYLRWEPGGPDPTQLSEEQLAGADYVRKWRCCDTYQIVHPGLDEQFGNGGRFRFTVSGDSLSPDGGDYDNICSFAEGTLEDEIE